jgi:nitrate/nitrite transporter NarK
MMLLPSGQRREGRTIDYRGIALIATFVTAIVFALTELGRRDAPPSVALIGAAVAVFVIALVVFVWHERRVEVPVIDLDLLRRKEFACSNAISFCFGSAWVGMSAMIPLFVQTVYGMSPAESGAITAPRSVVMVASSAFWTWLLPRTGFRKPLAAGLIGYATILVVVGLGLRDPMFGGWTMPTFWWSLLSVAMGGFFFGVANPSMSNAALNLAPDRIAAVAGLRGMFSTLGSAIGVAVMVLIASRAPSTGEGLQHGFMVMAGVVAAAVVFVAGVPATVHAARAQAASEAGAAEPSEGSAALRA